VPHGAPNFSPFPYGALPRLSRADAALQSALARWLRVRPLGARTAKLVGEGASARLVGACTDAFDPHAAHAEVRLAGASLVVACAARPIRALAQRLFGGPAELDAPRPLTAAEEATWVLVVAAMLEDTGVPGEVWPAAGLPPGSTSAAAARAPGETRVERSLALAPTVPAPHGARTPTHHALEVVLERRGSPWTCVIYVPRSLDVRVPPPRPLPDWSFDVPVVVGRCRLEREELARLAVRDVVTIERALGLAVGDGAVPLTAAPNAVEARVAIGYNPAPMTQPIADASQVELTVSLGTTRLSLRQLGELAVGAVVPLGRPLAGPYEVRAAGRLIGRGELVDVDGELGVRIISLEE